MIANLPRFLLLVSSASLLTVDAFVPVTRTFSHAAGSSTKLHQSSETAVKPTGTSFLPKETVERCGEGSPVEKVKIEKDGTSAFIDVYEFARKIRESEMTWEDLDKADLETVRNSYVGYVVVVWLNESNQCMSCMIALSCSMELSIRMLLSPSHYHSYPIISISILYYSA
jgi:hypothetical protein